MTGNYIPAKQVPRPFAGRKGLAMPDKCGTRIMFVLSETTFPHQIVRCLFQYNNLKRTSLTMAAAHATLLGGQICHPRVLYPTF